MFHTTAALTECTARQARHMVVGGDEIDRASRDILIQSGVNGWQERPRIQGAHVQTSGMQAGTNPRKSKIRCDSGQSELLRGGQAVQKFSGDSS